MLPEGCNCTPQTYLGQREMILRAQRGAEYFILVPQASCTLWLRVMPPRCRRRHHHHRSHRCHRPRHHRLRRRLRRRFRRRRRRPYRRHLFRRPLRPRPRSPLQSMISSRSARCVPAPFACAHLRPNAVLTRPWSPPHTCTSPCNALRITPRAPSGCASPCTVDAIYFGCGAASAAVHAACV